MTKTSAAPVTADRLKILGAALLFSTGGAAIKACTFSAWEVACLRSAVAGIALLFVLERGREWFRPRALLVGAAYAATMLLYVGGNKLTTAANTIFLQATAPMYVLLLGPFLLRERARRADLGLTLAIGAGMLLFFLGSEPPLETAPDPARGNMFGALAGLTWALTLIGLRWLGRESGTSLAGASVIAGNFLAAAAAAPFAFPMGGTAATDWAIIGYLGLFQIGLAYVLLTRGVGRVPALEVSLLLLLEPVASAVWAWMLHGERPGPWSLAGCAIILLATLVSTLMRRR